MWRDVKSGNRVEEGAYLGMGGGMILPGGDRAQAASRNGLCGGRKGGIRWKVWCGVPDKAGFIPLAGRHMHNISRLQAHMCRSRVVERPREWHGQQHGYAGNAGRGIRFMGRWGLSHVSVFKPVAV